MTHISQLFLKVKLNGLGWEHGSDASQAYPRLLQKIADIVQADSELVSESDNKTVSVVICRELDEIHNIEGQGLLVQAERKLPRESKYL